MPKDTTALATAPAWEPPPVQPTSALEALVLDLRATVAGLEARLDRMSEEIVTRKLVVRETAGGPNIWLRAIDDAAELCVASGTDVAYSHVMISADLREHPGIDGVVEPKTLTSSGVGVFHRDIEKVKLKAMDTGGELFITTGSEDSDPSISLTANAGMDQYDSADIYMRVGEQTQMVATLATDGGEDGPAAAVVKS